MTAGSMKASSAIRGRRRDNGAVLPLALVVSVVLAIVGAAIVTYTATALRSTAVTESRVARLADAEAGMQRVLNDLATVGCPSTLPAGENGSTLAVTACQAETVSLGGDVQYSLVLTAERLEEALAFHRDGPQNNEVEIGGQVFIAQNATGLADPTKLVAPGLVIRQAASCPGPSDPPLPAPDWLSADNVECTTDTWRSFTETPTIPWVGGFDVPAPHPAGCRVEESLGGGPRVINNLSVTGDAYFASGVYRVTGRLFLDGDIVMGHHGEPTLDPIDPCYLAQLRDTENAASGGIAGVVFVLEGNGRIFVDGNDTVVQFFGLDVGGDRRVSLVSYTTTDPAPVASTFGPTTRNPNVDGNQVNRREGIFQTGHPSAAFAFFGEVWTPEGFFDIDTMSSNGDAGAAFQGGATISRFKAKTSNDVSGIIFQGDDVPVREYYRIRVEATADSASTTVSAVARVAPDGVVIVQSWRVI